VLRTEPIGHSVQQRAIILYRNTPPAPPPSAPSRASTLLIGGLHGDERATVTLLETFLQQHAPTIPTPLLILPIANPDGYTQATRHNARSIDLNRNTETGWNPHSDEPPGPHPWSEPESRALRDLILRERPAKIVLLHWALGELDPDGPQSIPLAHALWATLTERERLPYRLRTPETVLSEPIPPCPGSFGQWCGHTLRYPEGTRPNRPSTLTLELPYHPHLPRPNPLPPDHLTQLHAAWKHDPAAYLQAIEPGIHRMLLAACAFQ
jgi:hypothetical protein